MIKLVDADVPVSPHVSNEKAQRRSSLHLRRASRVRAANLPLIFIFTVLLVFLTIWSLQPPGTLSTIFALISIFSHHRPSFPSHLQIDNNHVPSTEAYATFLSDINLDPMYLLQTRLLLYQLRHDPTTADLSRDFVVLTTPQVPDEVEFQLRDEGAIVIRRPLIDHMPGDRALEGRQRWKDQYSKLNIFNLTAYERILYLDSDTLVTRSLVGLWDEEGSWPQYGLSSVGVDDEVAARPALGDGSEFNAGFFMARPSELLFDDLLKQDEYDPYYLEQALLNHYFNWNGERPWTEMGSTWNTIDPNDKDLADGVATLHGHFWELDHETKLGDYWLSTINKMEEHWLVERGVDPRHSATVHR